MNLLAVILIFFSSSGARAQATFERVEVPIGTVFVVSQGYDDNDNIGGLHVHSIARCLRNRRF